MGGIIVSALLGVFAIVLFLIAYRHHKEKGVILTNAWLLASEKERESMDERIKKYEYQVARNCYLMLGALFSLIAVTTQLEISPLFYFVWAIKVLLLVIICIYAIAQYKIGEKLRESIKSEHII